MNLFLDYQKLCNQIDNLYFRGVKGTTGTQASFMDLFNNDSEKVKKLDNMLTERMGFKHTIPICGQTYPRKIDTMVLECCSGIAGSLHKMCTDIRLLMNLKEIEEPFEKTQVGSSAMAYKRNPMRSERICSLARYVINNVQNANQTESIQWFERTLDDSANRRIVLAESFLATDVILTTALDIVSGLIVWPKVIESHIKAELPFMATENIIMECVKAGGDRQELHEHIRELSMKASQEVKEKGNPNNLLDLIKGDSVFAAVHDKLDNVLDPKLYIGRCSQQVDEFINECIDPVFEENKELMSIEDKDKVSC